MKATTKNPTVTTVTKYIEVPEAPKMWYTSKTLWTNVILLVLGIITLLNDSPLFTGKSEVLGLLGIATTILNLVLRFMTTNGITFDSKKV